jgi:hypothetical protein
MTVGQLFALAKRHGYELVVNEDGNPKLKPLGPEARLPGKVKYVFQINRPIVVDWFRRNHRPEWEKCRFCLATIHESLTPDDAEAICWTKRRCPYRSPI